MKEAWLDDAERVGQKMTHPLWRPGYTGLTVVTSQRLRYASGVLEARIQFLSSREYYLRLIATASAQAGFLASVVALESLRATHSGKNAACC